MLIKNTNVEAQFDWGEIYVQGGEDGIVASPDSCYKTAFVEAFPKNLKTFIRGEGETVQEAEKSAWEQYQRFISCEKHEFERRGYKNGAGFCKNCDMFQSKVFEPTEKCVICSIPTYNTYDIDGNWYCKEHSHMMPEEKQTEIYKRVNRSKEVFRIFREKHGK